MSERASFETLSSLQVPTPSGRMVPLSQFATFVEEQEFPLVWRRDRVPTLTVRADVVPGVLPDDGGGCAGAEDRRVRGQAAGPTRSRPAACTRRARSRSASVFAVVPLMIVLMLLAMMMVMLVSFRRLAMVVACCRWG
jgi:multidrug efflux pump subunit AcrB